MYQQTLYKVVEPVKLNTIKRLNKSKKWKYGYNKENDVIVISKTGQIGEILEIQDLKIALPKKPKEIYSYSKYEFVIDGERLYRVMNHFITIKYEYQGNEKEYNPSWTQSG